MRISTRPDEGYIFAIDHGTSGFKNGITNLKAEIIDFEFEPTPIYLFDNGGAEQDPDEWWSAFLKSAKRLLGRNRDKSDKILAFSVSGQWACTVAVDREGKSLMNAISWMDSRGAPYIQKLLRDKLINISGYGLSKLRKWIKKTGGGPGLAGKDPISHILYIKNEFPDIYEKTYKFLDSKDYINLKLTGKFAATYDSVHINWITDIRDPYHIKYDQKLMKILGVEPDKFPKLIYSTDVLGTIKPELASELGVSKGIKVMGGTPDLHAVLIGSGGLKDFQSVVYIGTSSFLLTHVPFKRTDVFHNLASIPSAIPGKYFAASEQETAGACLNFLLDNILRKPIIKENSGNNTKNAKITDENTLKDRKNQNDPLNSEEKSDLSSKISEKITYSYLDKVVEQTEAFPHSIIFTPWLYGERTPIEDNTIRGGFYNISLDTTIEDMVRAVFEGVALNSRWVLKYMEKFTDSKAKKKKGLKKLDPIIISGGGANSDIWCQIFADVLNRKILRIKDPIQGNIRGAAMLAIVGLGFRKFEDFTQLLEYPDEFVPNKANVNKYNIAFREFVNIYKKNFKIHKRLNSRSL